MVAAPKILIPLWTKGRYGTVALRVIAYLIDILVFLPFLVVSFFYYEDFVESGWGVIWQLSNLAITSAYFVYFHSRTGATIGKKLMHIRLRKIDGENAISFRDALIREAPWIGVYLVGIYFPNQPALSLGFLIPGIWDLGCVISIFYTLKNRSLDDLIAGVVLVNEAPIPINRKKEAPLEFHPAKPIQRFSAGAINVLILIFANWLVLPPGSMSVRSFIKIETAEMWLITSSIAATFWLICGYFRTSPGMKMVNLKLSNRRNRTVRLFDSLARNSPYLLIYLGTTFYAEPEDLVLGHGYSVILLVLLFNGLYLCLNSRSLLDAAFNIRVNSKHSTNPLLGHSS